MFTFNPITKYVYGAQPHLPHQIENSKYKQLNKITVLMFLFRLKLKTKQRFVHHPKQKV